MSIKILFTCCVLPYCRPRTLYAGYCKSAYMLFQLSSHFSTHLFVDLFYIFFLHIILDFPAITYVLLFSILTSLRFLQLKELIHAKCLEQCQIVSIINYYWSFFYFLIYFVTIIINFFLFSLVLFCCHFPHIFCQMSNPFGFYLLYVIINIHIIQTFGILQT